MFSLPSFLVPLCNTAAEPPHAPRWSPTFDRCYQGPGSPAAHSPFWMQWSFGTQVASCCPCLPLAPLQCTRMYSSSWGPRTTLRPPLQLHLKPHSLMTTALPWDPLLGAPPAWPFPLPASLLSLFPPCLKEPLSSQPLHQGLSVFHGGVTVGSFLFHCLFLRLIPLLSRSAQRGGNLFLFFLLISISST